MAKTGKSAPPPFNSRKKNTQSFVSKEKNRTILRQKGMPIDHMYLFVASVAMYNNLTLTSIRRIQNSLTNATLLLGFTENYSR